MFRFIGGKCYVAKFPALVKTESMFYPSMNITCITTTLIGERQELQQTKWFPVVDPTVGDWLSIKEAIRYSMRKGELNLHIEHNNLQVVQSLVSKKRNVEHYASYKRTVLELANQTEWTGIRWIPTNTNYDELEYQTEKAIQLSMY